MSFQNAHNFSIHGSTFADVQGHLINNAGTGNVVSIQHGEPGDPLRQMLYPAIATGAAYDSRERCPPAKCQPGTREAILEDITSWIEEGATASTVSGSVMWLHGPAGAGKSAIAQTICESSADQGQLAASFFFSRGSGSRGKSDQFVATIAYQLAMSGSSLLRDQIARAVKENPLLLHRTLVAQVEHLIIRPLQSVSSDRSRTRNRSPFLIVIDGLDECQGNPHQTLLLKSLLDVIRVHHIPLYILIVSRPEPHIKHIFDTANISEDNCRVVSLYGDWQASEDVLLFLQTGFERIRNDERHSDIMKHVPKPWPSESIIRGIADKSGGYFIYASTILKFVDEEYCSPIRRLEQVFDESSASNGSAFAELDRLYLQVLSTSPSPDLLKRVLGCIVASPNYSSNTPGIIELIFKLRPGEVMLALRGLHSLLNFHESMTGIDIRISATHASLGDFLMNKERAGRFFIDPQEHHKNVTVTCWRRFSSPSDNFNSESLYLELQESFTAHFDAIVCKDQIIDGLRGANAATWAPLVLASRGWKVTSYKASLPEMVERVINELKHLDPRPEESLNELTSLANSIYIKHLSLESIDNIRLFHGLWMTSKPGYLPSDLWLRHVIRFLELNLSLKTAHHIWDYSSMMADINPSSFSNLMNDPSQSGDLIATRESLESQLALRCIKHLTRGASNTDIPLFCIATCLSRLTYTPSMVNHVEAYLRAIDLGVKFSELANPLRPRPPTSAKKQIIVLLKWLQELPEPPMDIILPWASCYEIKIGDSRLHVTWEEILKSVEWEERFLL